MRTSLRFLVAGIACVLGSAAEAQDYRARLPEDEVIYFLLPDRFENGDTSNDEGGLRGDRLATGFDPTNKGFFHGGDLKGLTKRLDYIQGLGATAVWLSPIFKNKPVQGPKGQESAGYHGYWVTDFTRVDPHLGTDADFKAFVDAAHARGMKVYMDIIANHTADVLYPNECEGQAQCLYRSIADLSVPAARRHWRGGDQRGLRRQQLRERSSDPNYAYTMTVKPAERNVKVPAWLNDPIYYHNRGDTTFRGESSTMGDFVGLDDLFTEHPRVVDGHDRDLRIVDRPLRSRRLPHRHGAPCEPGVLGQVRARDPRACTGEGYPELPHLRRSRGRHGSARQAREAHAARQAAERARLRVRRDRDQDYHRGMGHRVMARVFRAGHPL